MLLILSRTGLSFGKYIPRINGEHIIGEFCDDSDSCVVRSQSEQLLYIDFLRSLHQRARYTGENLFHSANLSAMGFHPQTRTWESLGAVA